MPSLSKGTEASTLKRSDPHDPTISPPPTKRKVTSAMSKSAVANFFTPTSQKPAERTTWTERAENDDSRATLLVAKYEPAKSGQGAEQPPFKRRKIAAFDLDSTLITSASGKKHPNDAADWKWWDSSVPGKLRELYEEQGFHVVVFTNQGGITLHMDPSSKGPKIVNKGRIGVFKQKVNAILTQLDLPLTLYAATGKDMFRKPRTGMWTEMCDDVDLDPAEIDLKSSIFVGDAGGRFAIVEDGLAFARDFSCCDRNLAHNVGITYLTPEEFFRAEKPRPYKRDFDLASYSFTEEDEDVAFERKNDKDIVLCCGPPGAGKSTFYWKQLKPLGYERVNQDTLVTKSKCFKAAAEFLKQGKSVLVDNTNPDPDTRVQWVDIAKKNKVPIRCVWFKTPRDVCEHNDAVRSLNKTLNPESRDSLPQLAFNSFSSRFREPKTKEGFQDVTQVDFRFRGTREEYAVWARYWL